MNIHDHIIAEHTRLIKRAHGLWLGMNDIEIARWIWCSIEEKPE